MNAVKDMLQRTDCLDLGPRLDRQCSNCLRHVMLRSIMGKEQKQTVLLFCLPFRLKTTSVVVISFNRGLDVILLFWQFILIFMLCFSTGVVSRHHMMQQMKDGERSYIQSAIDVIYTKFRTQALPPSRQSGVQQEFSKLEIWAGPFRSILLTKTLMLLSLLTLTFKN